jgi:hypothetical protein
VDISRTVADIGASLEGGRVEHRFRGKPGLTAAATAHTDYVHDRTGLIEILLRSAGLRHEDPAAVESTAAATHWRVTRSTLDALSVILWFVAVAAAAAYCGLVAWKYREPRVMWLVPLFAVPRATIWLMAFWQRLFFGGPTKRIPDDRIARLSWLDVTSFPYRLRRQVGPLFGARRDVDPNKPARAYAALAHKALSFIPTAFAMLLPVAVAARLTGQPLGVKAAFGSIVSGVLTFTIYLIVCTAGEVVGCWRGALRVVKPEASA